MLNIPIEHFQTVYIPILNHFLIHRAVITAYIICIGSSNMKQMVSGCSSLLFQLVVLKICVFFKFI